MSTRHRFNEAVLKMVRKGDGNWAYETWTDAANSMAYFSFESERSAQLMKEFLWLVLKNRKQLIHKGRKP